MDEGTLAKLEFNSIREVIAAHCACALGKRLALAMEPAHNTDLIRQWLAQVDELIRIAPEHDYPPMGSVHDVRDAVQRCAVPPPLEPEELADIAETLRATAPLRTWLLRVSAVAPSLAKLGQRVDDLSPIGITIGEAIDARGEVRDHASAKLNNIRRAIDSAQASVKVVFDRLLRSQSHTKLLQYSGATFHNDRMVLPLKAEYRGRIAGIIHRSSDSGSTLFVEPAASVELNNSIIRLRDDETKEITEILRQLTRRIHANHDAILTTLRAMGVLDLIAAKARYARKRRCVCPLIDEGCVLDVQQARHPLLIELFAAERESGAQEDDAPPRTVVPSDIRLGDDFDVLVVTGPNTGGKTVIIKTVGLLALMTQCGVPIPVAAGSRMPVYKSIFIDIGDEQSLQQSLSTFSSHLSNQLRILRRSGSRSLVLIDELGAGTDPDEGAAIGHAIIGELLRLSAKAIVTTHLSALKAVPFSTERADNACVDFDAESMAPTYVLHIGEPGTSNALVIAERLGMSTRLVTLARDYLSNTSRALDQAIRGTLKSRRQAEKARRDARAVSREAEDLRRAAEAEGVALRRKQAAFDKWTAWVNALEPKDDVYIKTLDRTGRVVRVQLHKQVALVSACAMDIEVPLRDIEPIDESG